MLNNRVWYKQWARSALPGDPVARKAVLAARVHHLTDSVLLNVAHSQQIVRTLPSVSYSVTGGNRPRQL